MNSILFKLILISFFSLITTTTLGQNNCTCKIKALDNKNEFNNIVDSLNVINHVKKLKESKSKNCIYEGLKLEFNFRLKIGDLDGAFTLLNEQEKLLNTIDCYDQLLYGFLSNKTKYYRSVNDLEKLSDFAFKTLIEAEKLNDTEKEINSIKEIVYLFTRLNEDEKNWDYIKRAQKLIISLKTPELIPHHYSWLAYEYENKYTITERVTLIDSALIFIKQAKKGAFKFKKFDEITKCYRVEEACAYHKGDLRKALVNIDSAIYYGKKIKGHKNLSGLYLSKAWDHLDLGEFENANTWMDTALFYNNEKLTAASMMMFFEASQVFEGAGKLDKAYESYKTFTRLKDSILSIEKVEKINELEQKYYKVKNEQKIFQLEKTKQFYSFLIIASLLAILAIVLFFRQRSFKNKQKQLETEQRLNRARINPHFFFNAMASLQNLSQQENSYKTTLYTSRLSKIMRQSLESTYEEVITLEEEIDFLTQYLEIQKLRYPDKFEYKFSIADDLEINELKLPGMLMQPFVENSIEHGFKDIDYLGVIKMTFEDANTQIKIIIEDNGSGLNIIEKERNHKSRAMQIIQDRLLLFNKQYKSKSFYKIETPTNKIGFKIVITLPKLY